MNLDDFVFLVGQMREKQRAFFRTRPEDRPPSLVREAKALEARVDAAIGRLLDPKKEAQTSFLEDLL